MYMLARHALTRDFYLDEDEFRQAVGGGILPSVYQNHHLKRARSSKQMPKRFCMDEYHRTGGIEGIRNQVIQDIREGRKHNNQIAIASQRLEDFDDAILDMATSVYICNAASEHAVGVAVSTFGLNKVAEDVLRHQLTGPTAKGASMYCVFKTKEGTIRQKLFLTLGPAELWALSTTAEDAALRRSLYEAVGPRAARRALSLRFPSGSAKPEIETRVARIEAEGARLDEKARGSVIDNLSLEIQRQMFSAAS
jgi:intracellular multiplication protein IcmB